MSRENAGYTITDSVRVGDYEIVIGERKGAPAPYVCWYCKDDTNYFWGDYCSTRSAALRSLCNRIDKDLRVAEAQKTHAAAAR